jgi:hypothetical protein
MASPTHRKNQAIPITNSGSPFLREAGRGRVVYSASSLRRSLMVCKQSDQASDGKQRAGEAGLAPTIIYNIFRIGDPGMARQMNHKI